MSEPEKPGEYRTLGPYRLVEKLGAGGMGTVHLGLDPLGRAVAIKVMHPHIAYDDDARARLGREVETLSRVRHPGVAAVLDADTEGESPYIVTEFVPGPPLDQVVAEQGALSPKELTDLARGLADAITAIHAAGVVHRDVKPGNVLLEDGHPVLIDFGIAHIADDSRLTHTGLVMGTPGYISPELVSGAEVTRATDWYGWAATLAYAASGVPPFGRGPITVVLDRVTRGEPDLSRVDPRLAPILAAALSPQPSNRPPADVLIAALQAYGSGQSTAQLTTMPDSAVLPPPLRAATRPLPAVPPTRPQPTRPDRVAQPYAPAQQRDSQRQRGVAPGADVRRPAGASAAPRPVDPRAAAPRTADPRAGAQRTANQRPADLRGPVQRPVDQRAAVRPVAAPVQPRPAPVTPLRPDPSLGGAWVPGVQHPHVDPRIGKERHSGFLTGLLVMAVGLVAVLPPIGIAAIALWNMAARTSDRAVTSLVLRRFDNGVRSTDRTWSVVTSPWHLLSGVLGTVLAFLLPLLVAVPAAFGAVLGWYAATGDRLDATHPACLGFAALIGLVLLWWGPGGTSLRRGSRSLARGLVGDRPTGLLAGTILAVAGLVLLAWGTYKGLPFTWWPVGGQYAPDVPLIPDLPDLP